MGAAGLLAANYVVSEGLHGSVSEKDLFLASSFCLHPYLFETKFAGWWRLVFGVSSAVLLTTAAFFMAWGSGSVQYWNEPPESVEPEPEPVEEPSRLESVLE